MTDANVIEQTEPAASPDMEELVALYVTVRDRLRELEKEHEKRIEPLKERQNQLSGKIMDILDGLNTQSMRTKQGTCYTSTRYSASLADADAFMKFIIANNKFELLDRRANATAVKDYVASNGIVPPGCNLTALKTLGVNRPRS